MLLVAFLLLPIVSSSKAQPTVTFTTVPENLQLFPRDLTTNKGTMTIAGIIESTSYDSIAIKLFRNSTFTSYHGKKLSSAGKGKEAFNISISFPAELAEYSIEIYFQSKRNGSFYLTRRDSIVAGDVFLVSGQSNAILGSDNFTLKDEYCRTYGVYTSYSQNLPFPIKWDVALGTANAYKVPTIGMFALQLAKTLKDSFNVPICI